MNFQDMNGDEILAIANPMMDNLMDASTEIDYEKHVIDFSQRLKDIVTKEHLEYVCNEYQSEKGLFKDRKFTSVFKRPDSVAIIWKQTFTKVDGDYVAEMVLVNKNGKFLVDHVMVF